MYPFYKTNPLRPEAEEVYKSLSLTNKKAIKDFCEICSIKSKSIKRGSNRRRALIRFFDFLEKDWDEITYEDYVLTAKAISESKLGTEARNGERSFIKRFLNHSFEDCNKLFKKLTLLSLEQKNGNEKLTPKDLLSNLEIEKLIKATSNMKHKTLISLLFETAGRPEEILKLRWSDCDLKKNIVYLYSVKTKQNRSVPINLSAGHLKRLKEELYVSEEDFIFFSKNPKKQMSNSSLNFILKNLQKKAGLKKNVYGYVFRHTRLTTLIQRLTPKVYEEVAGHSLEMGMRTYAHLKEDDKIQEMREKVFEIKDLNSKEKHELEKRVEELETALKKEIPLLIQENEIIKKIIKKHGWENELIDFYS